MTLHTPMAAFQAALPAEHARLLRYFNRRVGREAAPDLVQEVFARMFGSGTLDRIDNPPAYLTRIARNLLIDIKRSKRSKPTAFYSLDEERDSVSCADQTWRIEAADLSHLYRVFLMRRVRRMSYKEIAASLGVSVATVDYHMVQALALCRAAVTAQW